LASSNLFSLTRLAGTTLLSFALEAAAALLAALAAAQFLGGRLALVLALALLLDLSLACEPASSERVGGLGHVRKLKRKGFCVRDRMSNRFTHSIAGIVVSAAALPV
jgi:hypothetical protein